MIVDFESCHVEELLALQNDLVRAVGFAHACQKLIVGFRERWMEEPIEVERSQESGGKPIYCYSCLTRGNAKLGRQ